MSSFYERDAGLYDIAAAYDRRLVPWLFAHWVDRVVGIADLQPEDRVVDLASGTGLITRGALEVLGADGCVHGVDVDAAMLEYAGRTIDDPRVTWHEAAATHLPLGPASVDAVICNQGFQFFPDRLPVLADVMRVLRPGGRLAIAVWGRLENNPWPAALAATIGAFLGEEVGEGTRTVCSLGDLERVRSMLRNAGFVDIDVTEVEVVARHPDIREAIDSQLAAVPFAAAVDELGARRTELVDAMARRLDPYTDPGGALAVPSTCVLARATTPR